MDVLHKELTDKIISAYFDVYNELGYGFLEKVYQNSLFLELKARGFNVEKSKSKCIIKVMKLESIMLILW